MLRKMRQFSLFQLDLSAILIFISLKYNFWKKKKLKNWSMMYAQNTETICTLLTLALEDPCTSVLYKYTVYATNIIWNLKKSGKEKPQFDRWCIINLRKRLFIANLKNIATKLNSFRKGKYFVLISLNIYQTIFKDKF